ncbi:group 1 glycosyl transferase [Granulicella cerasi]|uniref:Group 1 glycosyl transferase n=1 Tax=Granulicella cerasi TaxID=741063 RepID=A0ABW1Z958_9BACT|nr:group 1 glycosyl transferase [Granulicella cerasi]
MNRAACTIVSPNYLAYARTLGASYLRAHPGHRFFVLIVANLTDATPFLGGSFEPVMLHEIGVADLRAEAMKYDILELNTNVKPAFMLHLLAKHQLDTLVYLDPDIYVYAPLEPVFEVLDAGASAVLTPHMTTPVWDGKAPGEQDLLVNGTYNLGFIAVSSSEESRKLLQWWDVRCLEAGYSEGRSGLFVDQKWINMVPGLFADVHISRNAGLNMAYWNIHERGIQTTAEGYMVENANTAPVPLRFFHFSGIVVTDESVLSKHTNRYTLASRPDLTQLFADYKAAVRAEKAAASAAESLPYGFDALSDGTTITRLARRIYAAHQKHFVGTDPFDANGPFAKFAKQQKLVAGVVAPAKETWKDFNPRDRRVDTVHKLFGWALKLVGPHKYELLMRYFGHISILRNQSVFLRDARWPEEGK